MNLRLPQSPQQALRLVAALLTVLLVLLLGSVGASEPARPKYHNYVALGDSYTAAPFVPLTDVAYGCYRSSNNYPKLVAAALHIDDLQDRSCSGAQTKDLSGRQLTARGMTVPPQFEALSEDTDLVTVGIGANNHRLYARLATVCRLSKRICPLYDQRESLGRIVDDLRVPLVATLDEIRELAPNARVLLVSYPRLLPPSGDCARLPRMRPQDRATFRSINLRLREEMRAAADEARVEFVDFYAASYRHHVCARDPWIQGRIGSSRRGAALHPLPAGQAALARLIEQTLRRPPPESSRS
ncbi:MAG: SGNH/GDSL hydrolase family protein [Marmoricola sp.]